jgi:hypothetical protein
LVSEIDDHRALLGSLRGRVVSGRRGSTISRSTVSRSTIDGLHRLSVHCLVEIIKIINILIKSLTYEVR